MHIYEYLLCFMNVYFQMLAKNPEKKKKKFCWLKLLSFLVFVVFLSLHQVHFFCL